MKKAFGVLSVLVLIAVMLVSCNAEQNVNDTVEVSFNVSSSRFLTVTNQEFIPVSSGNLTWYYHGEKKTDTEFKTGQSASMDKTSTDYWTIISTGDALSATSKEFSQGQWYFEVKAIKEDGTQMYYGKTNGNVLLTKEQRTISISVSPFVSGVKGKLVLDSVNILLRNKSVANVAPNKLLINGVETTAFDVDESVNSISFERDVEPGTYTVEVQRVGEDTGVILASGSRTVVVYSGLTTTIFGSIEEDTTTGTFVPQPVRAEGTKDVVVSGSSDVTVEFENVTPSMVNGKSTTVVVPNNVLTGVTSPKLSVAVKQASEASTDNSFTASVGNAVAAVIDLTLSAGSNPVTTFSSPVKVETYVAKNLSGFSFCFPGETWTKKNSLEEVTAAKDYYYDSTEGKLTFLTNHFSSFIVETSSAAVIGDTAYNSLSSAISHVEEGQTITAIKDVSSIFSSGITIDNGKTFTIDLNGHNYDKRLTIKNSNITIKNGTISGVDQPIVIYASTNDRQYNSVTIEDDVKIIGTRGFGIVIYPVNGYQVGYGTVLNLNGSIENVESGLFVLGTIKNSINDSSYPVKVNIGPTAKITSFAGGIHENGTAEITVEEGAVFDCVDTAIEVRAGKLVINGGDFKSTADSFSCNANGSGSTTSGAAIAIAQHTTKKDISVVINGGTFIGVKALNESNPQENDPQPQVQLDVKGGTFIGEVSVTDSCKFITGGTFSSQPSDEYIADRYCAVAQGDKWIVQEAPVVIVTKGYATLEDAVRAAENGDTIVMLRDSAGNGIGLYSGATGNKIPTKDITIDLNSFTYTIDGSLQGSSGTVSQAFHLEQGCAVTIKNGKIASTKANMLIQNYCNLTLDNMVLDFNKDYPLSNNQRNITIKDTTITSKPGNGIAFDLYSFGNYNGTTVTVKGNSVINGTVELDRSNNAPLSLIIEGGTFNNGISKKQTDNCTVVIKGGTFSCNPTGYVDSNAYDVIDNGNTWTVTAK